MKRRRNDEADAATTSKAIKTTPAASKVTLDREPVIPSPSGRVEFQAAKLRGEALGLLATYLMDEEWPIRRLDAEKIFGQSLSRSMAGILIGASSWARFSQWCPLRSDHCRINTHFLAVAEVLETVKTSREWSAKQLDFADILKSL